jgi:S-adenosylmethionine hydrolase
VGGSRMAVGIETGRADVLIGPDNGVLIPAARRLGGVRRCFAIENPAVLRQPVSDTFHGRDVFATCAGWLARGVPVERIGRELSPGDLAPGAFVDAAPDGRGRLNARVIHVNGFGSATLNVPISTLGELGVRHGDDLCVETAQGRRVLPFVRTFSDTPAGEAMVLADPYERVVLAVNLGSFAAETGLQRGARIELWRA